MSSPAKGSEPHPSAFRPDIEGMRAVAIGLVLIYHAGVKQLPGGFIGVDVFFVISGFLITGLLIREVETTGRVSLARFYARRAKRLLPATAVVLIATAFLTWWTVSRVQWRTFGWDIIASAGYVVNWRLADRSVDYLAEDIGPSPVQHFWSLAVEEQFYIVWPLLIVALVLLLRRRPSLRPRPVLAVGILAVIVPSFVWSIHYTSSNPEQAFFVTPTRLWELGVGALVALGVTAWGRIPRTAAIALGWAGLATVVISAFTITAATAWPGHLALAPVLGTAAMIIAGSAAGPAGPTALLSLRPAVWVGGLSYSLYLWHWPLLVTAAAHWGDLGAKKGLLVVAVSFIPAYLSTRLVENPIRFAKPLTRSNSLTLSLGANFTAIGAAAGLVLVLLVPTAGAPAGNQARGAAALDQSGAGTLASLSTVEFFTPDPTRATEDVPAAYLEGCQQTQVNSTPIRCEYGAADGGTTIVVVGDSKVLQYESALRQIATAEGWRVISYTMSACGFHDGMQIREDGPYTACSDWNAQVLTEILDVDPDLVLTSQRIPVALQDPTDPDTGTRESMVDGLVSRWQTLDDAGIPVAVIIDNPTPDITVYECVAENPDDLEACTFDREAGIERSAASVQRAAVTEVDNATAIDLIPFICPDDVCVPVIGNVLVYRQTSHLTDTYARTLEPQLRQRLLPLVESQN